MEPRQLNTTEVTDILREHGITSTLQRVEIARILLSKNHHLSADEVLRRVNQGRSLVSKATVYNTLRLFSAKGLANEIIADPAKMFYEPTTGEHHHFFNLDTGELTDIDPDLIGFQIMPDAPEGTEFAGVNVVIRVRQAETRQ